MDKRQLRWGKDKGNPIIPYMRGTWKHHRTANNSVVLVGDTYYFYYRGGYGCWWEGYPGHSAIGVMTIPYDQFDGKTWNEYMYNPIITHDQPNTFNNKGPLDPVVVCVNSTFYLYFAGVSFDPKDKAIAKRECPVWKKSIGMAISNDGFNFKKYDNNPIIENAAAPTVLYKEDIFYLFYTHKGYIWLSTSKDGINFRPHGGSPVLSPGAPGKWDSNSVGNNQILLDDGRYYLVYDGNDKHYDYPSHFGVACSEDLLNWRKYPGNPIFARGGEEQWDDGGIWVGDILKHGDTYYLWYEGRSGGKNRNEAYSPGGFSQIGLATLKSDTFYEF